MKENLLCSERGKAIAKVLREYEQVMGRSTSTFMRYDVEYYLERGMETDVMLRAIEITAGKSADWRYTKAILKRLLEENTLTMEVWECKLQIKKLLLEYKKLCPHTSESNLLPFIIIKVYSELPYFKNLEADMAAFIRTESTKKVDENWIDEYVDKD